ncbi:T7SS effector LXG polymorphic toxin [Ureibacillus acetophenoni]|uniref:WXG superfamily protein probably secreted by type VII secretion system n=1 Tax=Ureibacillus acetophenoni TaxID=614649 RepID=A0A285UQM0_9BACL|nr:T7SS effector LXG polymorphic toxin [Ureibacillus acetophenoni]SOC44180.1 WXG superfamily protein probably secreted by type VII secretion system [Ureibacillus acetophenoni]
MKVLDVNNFQQGLERNLSRLRRLESEMKQIETAIQGLTNLEESLKGQGGEALRGFYENCHLPFLEFFNTFKTSFTNILQQMDAALTSLEPDSSGYISQSYLEGEVEQGLEVASQVTEDLTNETNQIMSEVSDIVSLPNLDDSEVQVGVADAKAHRDDTVEQLNVFDLTQTMALNTIQNDLILMKTWITNIESMITEGLTDVNFPAEQWKAFAQQNPLMITLAARTMSMDSIIGMDPLLAPGMIGGANPYSLSSIQLTGQLPIYNFGINGASVSTNFVSFKKKQEEEIAKELSCPVPDVNEVTEEENGFLAFLGDIGNGAVELGKGALTVGKEVADFIILDDINTLMDPNASGADKGFAVASFIPIGKLVKGGKLVGKIIDSDVDDVVKKSNVDEVVDKGKGKVTNVNKTQTKVIDDVESGKVSLETNKHKGNYGEMKMDVHFESQGYERINIDRVTSLDDKVIKGIDGVYFDPGPPPKYIIGEAKYGSSNLSQTKDGKQMSDTWVEGKNRLEKAVGKDAADDILLEGYDKVLVNTKEDGTVVTKVLDAKGNIKK